MTEKRKDDNLIQQPSAEQILNFLVENGTISLDGVEEQMKQTRLNTILSIHPYAITLGKDGRWRTYVKDEQYTGGRRQIARSTKESLLEALVEAYDHPAIRPLHDTMETLREEWLAYKALHVSPSTIDRVRNDWDRYYKGSEVVKKPLNLLTKLDLDIWVHEMIRKHQMTKHQYVNFSLILRQELDYAVDKEIIPGNPFRRVKVDTRRILRPEHKKRDLSQVYTAEELKGIRKLAWEDFEKKLHPVHQLTPLAVLFMFYTGLRIGEVCGVRYEDLEGNRITVRRMIHHPDNTVIDHTKGTFGDRTIPLIPQAMELITAARERQQAEDGCTDGYIFSMTEEPVLYSSVTKAFYRYCKELGIEAKSSHKARKTFISSLIDGNVNINTVRQIAGHMDERTTLNNYCFDRSTEEEKLQRMERAIMGM